MVEENSHIFWVNSEALRRAGIDGKTKTNHPDGAGVVMKNQYGEPNGEN